MENTDPRYQDHMFGKNPPHEIYAPAQPDYTSRATVPVLSDKQPHTIVNNESSQIIRMFNAAFAACSADAKDYYPEPLRTEIDITNDLIYRMVIYGNYRSGFSTRQDAYEEAAEVVFTAFDLLEQRLSNNHYLPGEQLTEADCRLFSTLVRFDTAYYGAFKGNVAAQTIQTCGLIRESLT